MPHAAQRGDPAAVDGERLAGHVAGRVAGEEEEGAVELVGLTGAGHRAVAHHVAVGALVGEHQLGHLRGEPAGGERVDPHALAGPLHAELAGEVDDGALGGAVRRLLDGRRPDQPEHGRQVDDGAGPALDHVATGQLAEQEQAGEVHVDDLAEAVDGLVLGGDRRPDAGVVDEHVEVPVDRDGVGDEPLAVRIDRHVAGERHQPVAQLAGQGLESLGAPGRRHDRRPRRVQHPG